VVQQSVKSLRSTFTLATTRLPIAYSDGISIIETIIVSVHFCALGYSELAEHLVEKYGAAVEALSIKKQTPMHLAAQNGMKVLYVHKRTE
jgi:hypothetical protein